MPPESLTNDRSLNIWMCWALIPPPAFAEKVCDRGLDVAGPEKDSASRLQEPVHLLKLDAGPIEVLDDAPQRDDVEAFGRLDGAQAAATDLEFHRPAEESRPSTS
jgi:hypothetical protein